MSHLLQTTTRSLETLRVSYLLTRWDAGADEGIRTKTKFLDLGGRFDGAGDALGPVQQKFESVSSVLEKTIVELLTQTIISCKLSLSNCLVRIQTTTKIGDENIVASVKTISETSEGANTVTTENLGMLFCKHVVSILLTVTKIGLCQFG